MTYGYRCPKHGEFNREFPMGEAVPATTCPRVDRVEESGHQEPCGRRCPRVFDAVVHFGLGFSPYGDRIQHSKELSRHFGGKD